jgi:hypothetical protein
MSWVAATGGGLVVIAWVLTARAIAAQAKAINRLTERIAFLEAKVNGLKQHEER